MKILVLVFLLYFGNTHAQCPAWTTSSFETVDTLLKVAKRELHLPDSGAIQSHEYLCYRNLVEYSQLSVRLRTFKGQQGASSTSAHQLEYLFMSGVALKIDALFKLMKADACLCPTYTSGDQWIKFSGTIVKKQFEASISGMPIESIIVYNENR